jgi:hypothetical protein
LLALERTDFDLEQFRSDRYDARAAFFGRPMRQCDELRSVNATERALC